MERIGVLSAHHDAEREYWRLPGGIECPPGVRLPVTFAASVVSAAMVVLSAALPVERGESGMTWPGAARHSPTPYGPR